MLRRHLGEGGQDGQIDVLIPCLYIQRPWPSGLAVAIEKLDGRSMRHPKHFRHLHEELVLLLAYNVVARYCKDSACTSVLPAVAEKTEIFR